MQRRPIFQFDTDTQVGLDKLPVGAIVSVNSYATSGAKFFQLLNKTSLVATTTIANALSAGNILDVTAVSKIGSSDYASADGITGGTLKARLSGTTLYLTSNGVNA